MANEQGSGAHKKTRDEGTCETLMIPWDSYDAYLFDIDGTLLKCIDVVHYDAFCDALSHVAGRPLNLDGVMTHGNVDVAILRDAWALGGVDQASWRPRLPDVIERMGAYVERRRADLRIDVLPGAPEVLAHLRARGATLGVATGNLAEIGEVKLTHCGLRSSFDFGGYSDAHETRTEVFAAAARRARLLTSEHASICVFGDTPADIQAAKANGLDVIAVATGVFSYETLAALEPQRTLHALTDLL